MKPLKDTTIHCSMVMTDFVTFGEMQDGEVMVTMATGSDTGNDVKCVCIPSDRFADVVHAFGGVTRQDLEVWMENNSGDQMLMRSFISESGYFPECSHENIRLVDQQWMPEVESLQGSCTDCGVVMQYTIGDKEWKVVEKL